MNLLDLKTVFIVAELGINHNGYIENIYKMIDEAKEAGADAVKLQVMTGYDLVDKNLKFNYFLDGKPIEVNLADLFYENRVKKEWLADIYDYAKSKEIICFSTPFSVEAVDLLEAVNNPIYKISSGDITHIPLIESVAKTGKSIILSTGKSSLADIDRALNAVWSQGNNNVVLLHCISVYPTPYSDLNLDLIQSLSTTFKVPCGFSDHSEGYFSSSIAVAKGAVIIEKHFTLDKTMSGPDHWFSLDPQEFSRLVFHVRLAESMFGTSRKAIYENEKLVFIRASRSIVAKQFINQGCEINKSMIDYLRPGNGFKPYQDYLILGKKAKHDILEGQLIGAKDIDW